MLPPFQIPRPPLGKPIPRKAEGRFAPTDVPVAGRVADAATGAVKVRLQRRIRGIPAVPYAWGGAAVLNQAIRTIRTLETTGLLDVRI